MSATSVGRAAGCGDGSAQDALRQPLGERERAAVEAVGGVAGRVPARLAAGADAELGRREAEQLELAVVGHAVALVAYPGDRHADPPRGAQDRALDARARRRHGGAEPEWPV